MIEIDANEILFDLVQKHPGVKEAMEAIGFVNIIKPGMLQSAGRIMTIKKGAKMKGIYWGRIESIFKEHGFIIKED